MPSSVEHVRQLVVDRVHQVRTAGVRRPAVRGRARAPRCRGRDRRAPRPGAPSSTASACPPRPSVASTCTRGRPGRSRAGASSSRHRSSSTGTCVPRGSPMSTPIARRVAVPSSTRSAPVARPYRQIPIRSCPLPGHAPGTGEVAPGAGAAGDLAVRRRDVRRTAVRGPGAARALQPAGQHPLLDVGEVVFALREVGAPRPACPRSPPGCSPRSRRVRGRAPRTPAGAPGW